MKVEQSGREVIAFGESHTFATSAEAAARAGFVREALTWVGTPFVNKAEVKGSKGGVDCARMVRRAAIDSGLLPTFEMPDYSPSQHLHRSEETFVNFLVDTLVAREIESPQFGDILLWRVGRIYFHIAILVASDAVLHAWHSYGICCVTPLKQDPILRWFDFRGEQFERPVKIYSVWKG